MKFKTVSPGITRFEVEGSSVRGYLVRMRRNGSNISEFFSDARCGGKRKALKAAKDSYQQMLELMGPIVSPTKNRLTKRNTSGIVGVHAAYSTDNRYPNSDTWSYCASWVADDRKRLKISFSWKKYGETVAWELACLAREKLINDRDRVVALYEKGERSIASKSMSRRVRAKSTASKTFAAKKKTGSVVKKSSLKAPVGTKTVVKRAPTSKTKQPAVSKKASKASSQTTAKRTKAR